MGREIRKVPPNWQHPVTEDRYGRPRKRPMYDRAFADAVREWKDGYAAWERGERSSYFKPDENPDDLQFWEYESNPPEREDYRPWKDEDATWFQLWETVSEGTPISPPFATREELADYLAANGDEWDQQRRADQRTPDWMDCAPWGEKRARAFVFGSGWEPSMVIQDGRVLKHGEMALQASHDPQ